LNIFHKNYLQPIRLASYHYMNVVNSFVISSLSISPSCIHYGRLL